MLKINEIFFSIQGEGSRAGRPCVFVRLTGCPLRCSYCDTRHAFEKGEDLDEREILEKIERFPCRLVELTGGEPLAQPDVFPFASRLLDAGWEVVIETSGHVSLEGLDPRAVVIMDIKTPGSGQTQHMEWRNLDLLRSQDEIKLVLVDRSDFDWARDLIRREPVASRCTVLFAPAYGRLEPGLLGRWILDHGLPVRLQVQLHKYLWPERERGV
ncbi:MAG: radical SAM protein [Vicinamibacteria bacterium]|nr:radical SAM protein [Vicinamibacteria bacterium]